MLIADTKIEEDKLFIQDLDGGDQAFFDEPLGKFVSQTFIDEHYSASLYEIDSGNIFAGRLTNTLPTMSLDSASLITRSI